MTNLTKAIQKLYPTLNFANLDDTLANVRYDEPLPEGFTPPTQAEVDAVIARLDVPQIITSAQAIRALYAANLLTDVQAAVTQAGGLTLALWQHAPTFHRDDTIITQLAGVMGLTEQQVDDLFRAAAVL